MAEINMGSVAYLLGILSVVFAFFNPMAGLVLGIIGLIQSNRNKVEKARKLNKIGIVLSVIFIVITILFAIFFANSALISGSFPLF